MIIPDLQDLPRTPYDFTIVGSGPAGLYLAEALGRAGRRVLVVEQGPLDKPLNQGRGYYEIDATGKDYPRLGERLAAFGGTSGHWGGMSRPLSAAAFDERPYLQCRGWPIAYQEFANHLDAAKKWLGHTFGPEDPAYADPQDGFLPGPSAGLAAHQFAASVAIRRLGSELRPWIGTSRRVDLLASHRVVDLALGEAGTRIASLRVMNIRSGDTGKQPVDQVILATGGIENARLMLAAGRDLPAGNPLTGRHRRTGATFMEHPKFVGLEVYHDDSFPLADTGWQVVPGRVMKMRSFSLQENVFKKLELPRFGVMFWGEADENVQVADFINVLDRVVLAKQRKYRLSRPEFEFEQMPRDRSFIALSDKTDSHGQPLARMHWTLGEGEMRDYWKSINVFASLLSQCGAVRTRLMFDSFEDFAQNAKQLIQHHHIGTTAMSADDRTGVVDPDCQVHGLLNLHIAGSSVFPNADYVNPTLNLLALADRQARYLLGLKR